MNLWPCVNCSSHLLPYCFGAGDQLPPNEFRTIGCLTLNSEQPGYKSALNPKP